MAKEITSTSFEEILSEKEITVIDFWAPWCGPCKLLGPVIDELSNDNIDKENVSIGKVNVDENRGVASKYEIRGIPTVLFFKNGEVVDKLVGFKKKEEYQAKIDSLLL